MVLEERAASAWRMAGSEFTSVSERLLKIRLKFHFFHVSVIAVYAPTNEAGNEEETRKFYQALQECVRKTLKRDMLLVMGDFNARIGNDVDAWRGTIGMFGPGELNEKGVKLLDFCAFNNWWSRTHCFNTDPAINRHGSIQQIQQDWDTCWIMSWSTIASGLVFWTPGCIRIPICSQIIAWRSQ